MSDQKVCGTEFYIGAQKYVCAFQGGHAGGHGTFLKQPLYTPEHLEPMPPNPGNVSSALETNDCYVTFPIRPNASNECGTVSRYKVPAGMLKAVDQVKNQFNNEQILEAALCGLSENPIAPDDNLACILADIINKG